MSELIEAANTNSTLEREVFGITLTFTPTHITPPPGAATTPPTVGNLSHPEETKGGKPVKVKGFVVYNPTYENNPEMIEN